MKIVIGLLTAFLLFSGCLSNHESYYELEENPQAAIVEPPEDDIPPENTFDLCTNYKDDDKDGFEDCADDDCATMIHCQLPKEQTYVLCHDGIDNDQNGRADCEDPSCTLLCVDSVENTDFYCHDGLDNDGDDGEEDGGIDCADKDCEWFCNDDPKENTYDLCSDGLDNDEDEGLNGGGVDCEDDDCLAFIHCDDRQFENTDVTCQDEIDNDKDGDIDCLDEECKFRKICLPPSNMELEPITGGDSVVYLFKDGVINEDLLGEGADFYSSFMDGMGSQDDPINSGLYAGGTLDVPAGDDRGGFWLQLPWIEKQVTRDTIDLEKYFYWNLSWTVRKTRYMRLKVQWQGNFTGEGTAFEINDVDLRPDLDDDVLLDGETFVEYSVDMFTIYRFPFNAAHSVVPFQLWSNDLFGQAVNDPPRHSEYPGYNGEIEVTEIKLQQKTIKDCFRINGGGIEYDGKIFCEP